jgi:nitric oxide reductase subunit B
MVFAFRQVTPDERWPDTEKYIRISFWGLNVGLAMMILSNHFPGGVLQLYDVLQNGYWHARSAAFGHSMLMHTLEWARLRRTLQEADGPLAVLAFVAAGPGSRAATGTS